MSYILKRNYFDYAASAPPFEEAVEEFTRLSGKFFGNPSSAHDEGYSAFSNLERLKQEFLNLLKGKGKLILTSTGTEANNLVIHGHVINEPEASLLIAADVHPSVRFALNWYGDNSTTLPVTDNGSIDLSDLREALQKGVTLLCISHICNETGRIHPIEDIASLCREYGVSLLIDGVQAVGHINVDLSSFQNFYYTFSAHKFGGVRGAGGIITDNPILESVIAGGKQEYGLRAGTENIAALGAAVKALEISIEYISDTTRKLTTYIDKLRFELGQNIEDIVFNTYKDASVPGILSFSVPGLSASSLIADMSLGGFAVSSGSACHSNEIIPSHVIKAMGRSDALATGSIRVSMGPENREESVKALTEELIKAIKRSRS